jgi:type IV secretion system protein VirB10
LIRLYDRQEAFGQSRVLIVRTRLIMPNGRSIVLERQPGAESGGYAELDHHWLELSKAAAISILLGVCCELGTGANDNSIIRAQRRGAGDSLNQTGQAFAAMNSMNSRGPARCRSVLRIRVPLPDAGIGMNCWEINRTGGGGVVNSDV